MARKKKVVVPEEQLTFSEVSLDELNDAEDVKIENVCDIADEYEIPASASGVKSGTWAIRTSRPEAGNKNFITIESGGWSNCIKGKPTDRYCDVLSNCVGYADGRFNEIYNALTGHTGHKYLRLSCNAENFIERAKELGLEISSKPTLGGILVWQKGATLGGSDGAGHVAIVEQIIDDNTIYTSESNYGSTVFFNATRKNTNGRWGLGAAYKFRGCVINPAVKDIKIAPNVDRDPKKEQIQVKTSTLRVRYSPSLEGVMLGFAGQGYYNVLGKTKADGYTWIKIAANQYIAYSQNWAELLPVEEDPAPTPEPAPVPVGPKFKVGDKVVINGKLYASSNAIVASNTVSNKITYITRYAESGKHPYNTTGDLGWMDENAITLFEGQPVDDEIKVGDKVKVLKAVTYEGRAFTKWYTTYDVIQVNGDRIVIGRGRTITAAVNKINLQKA